jgi:ribonuclease P protein component
VPGTSNPDGKQQRVKSQTARAKFPRSLRLLRHSDFERVYKQGRRHFSASLTAFFLARQGGESAKKKATPMPGLRVGFTVGRALGGAVQRNRMKRRLREAVRLSQPPAEVSADVVLNPKKSLLTSDFEAVLNEVRRAFVVIEQKIGRKPEGISEKQNPGSRTPDTGSR